MDDFVFSFLVIETSCFILNDDDDFLVLSLQVCYGIYCSIDFLTETSFFYHPELHVMYMPTLSVVE